ncbi:hypothetical protein Dip510_001201 [Elusimicrobium posterum]|uniref:NAD(P)/FAD-dependent oxidoreductase n=1 Tax=Elusimicrobium posterum TaxID=3116653 RepID=UPI003C7770A9
MRKNDFYDVIIIGAGAAGLSCGLTLAKAGKNTLILEAQNQSARKILASGNGRCNATNINAAPQHYFGDKKLLESFFKKFAFNDCLHFLEEQGIILKEEDNGRYFPITNKATAVANALLMGAQESGCKILNNKKVTQIKKEEGLFTLTAESGESFKAQNVVLACGSPAYPQLSGSESGYNLAQKMGHNLVTPIQALCMINLQKNPLTKLQGIKTDARLTVLINGKKEQVEDGEIMFTAYGLTGIPALNISRTVNKNLDKNVEISINLLTGFTKSQLKKIINQRISNFKDRKLKDFFTGMLHESVAEVFLETLDIPKTFVAGYMKEDIKEKIITTLQDWRFTPGAAKTWNDAFCAAGGINTNEINPQTFESNLVKGLFIIGEILDIDGRSGGYNLHFAFGCGQICAKAIAATGEK